MNNTLITTLSNMTITMRINNLFGRNQINGILAGTLTRQQTGMATRIRVYNIRTRLNGSFFWYVCSAKDKVSRNPIRVGRSHVMIRRFMGFLAFVIVRYVM